MEKKIITIVVQHGFVDSVYCNQKPDLSYQVLDLDTQDEDEAAVNCSILDGLSDREYLLPQVECNKSVCTDCKHFNDVCVGCPKLDKERVQMDFEDRLLKAQMFDSLVSLSADTDNFAYAIISCLIGEGYTEEQLSKFFDNKMITQVIEDNKNI